MRIQCKCGNALSVDSTKYAGRKIACPQCGQRYRLPPEGGGAPMSAAPDAAPVNPTQAGIVALGQKTSFGWIAISLLITLAITAGGAWLGKFALDRIVKAEDMEKYGHYGVMALMWAPCLAFVVAGWITARFSPGRTIVEPAVAAVLSVCILFALAALRPGPVADLVPVDLRMSEATMLKLNFFFLAMFNAAMLACAGAYFGEVSQSRSMILSGKA